MIDELFHKRVWPLKDKLFRFARNMMGNTASAEDVIQDVFVKIWDRRKEIPRLKNPEAYAMTLTRNLCLDRMKAKSWNQDQLEPQYEEASPSPLVQLQVNEQLEQVHQVILQLPEQQRTVVTLRDMEGYSVEEIEEVTGLTPNAIRVNLSRARKKIREELEKLYSYGLQRT